ncbi:MAG: hypothetical protein GY859_04140, partial [Desulfobacterales bacterium]|nr:hypothetical protein [Desulfobacterales bacterium]
MKSLVQFRVGEKHLGMTMDHIQGIRRYESSAVVSREKGGFPVVMLEGRETPVCDLSLALGDPAVEPDGRDGAGRKLLISDQGGRRLALLVDRVAGITDVDEDEIDAMPPIFKGPSLTCFPRVWKRGSRMVLILNPDGLESAGVQYGAGMKSMGPETMRIDADRAGGLLAKTAPVQATPPGWDDRESAPMETRAPDMAEAEMDVEEVELEDVDVEAPGEVSEEIEPVEALEADIAEMDVEEPAEGSEGVAPREALGLKGSEVEGKTPGEAPGEASEEIAPIETLE